MGQVPAQSYIKHMKHTHAKSRVSKRLLSDKCESTQQWCNHLVEGRGSTIFGVAPHISQPSLTG